MWVHSHEVSEIVFEPSTDSTLVLHVPRFYALPQLCPDMNILRNMVRRVGIPAAIKA